MYVFAVCKLKKVHASTGPSKEYDVPIYLETPTFVIMRVNVMQQSEVR